MADKLVGATRAALGQGLAMGWGDEAEAWLRSKLGQGSYDQNLQKIRGEYGEYAKENPKTAFGLEMAGGAAPGLAMMAVPGGQPAAAGFGIQQLGKLAAMGAATGAVSGAGSAEEDRSGGALAGGVIGGALGVGLPMALRGTSAAGKWLAERLNPSETRASERAAGKLNEALTQTGTKPSDLPNIMAQDKAMGVPSVLANAAPGATDLAEAVAQRTGAGARRIEDTLTAQKLGARERSHQQVVKALKPGDYYSDLDSIRKQMSTRAAPLYDKAYQHGEVTDPEVLKFMQLPQFQKALKEAEGLLAAEGRTLDMSKPTVEVLDQVKRGLDTLIESQTDATTGKTTSLGRVYVQKKNEFLNALDNAVPDYRAARATYAGDAEIAQALRTGVNDWAKMDHEQVSKMVAGMGDAEKQALRTGVSRDLYSKLMTPSGNFNAAQRLIGSPEMQAKLQPLFDNPAEFNLFKTALERESQLFQHANRILGGSQTGKRMQMRESLESDSGIGEAVARAVTGGFTNSLTSLVGKAIANSKMTESTSAKLAQMLMSKDPHEVAAVVKLLEEQAAGAAPKAYRAGALERGATTGLTTAVPSAPQAPSDMVDNNLQLELDKQDEQQGSGSGESLMERLEREDRESRATLR